MFSIFLQTAIVCIKQFDLCCSLFQQFNNVFHKKTVHDTYWWSSSIACREKITDWIFRIECLD